MIKEIKCGMHHQCDNEACLSASAIMRLSEINVNIEEAGENENQQYLSAARNMKGANRNGVSASES